MRVSFNPGNVRELKSFFKTDVEFLDVLVTVNHVYIISDNVELYCHWVFDVISRDSFEKPVCFRLDRKKFLSLLSEGVITILVKDEKEVEITFKGNDGFNYVMNQHFQDSDVTTIQNNQEILKSADKFNPVKLKLLNPVSRVLRNVSSIVSVIDGIAVASREDIVLFYKTECENLNLYSTTLNFLLTFGETMYTYQNYVISRGDRTVIIARQVRAFVPLDYPYLSRSKSQEVLKVDFRPVYNLAKRCDGNEVYIDFDKGQVRIVDGRTNYRTRFKILDRLSSKKELDLSSFSLEDDGVAVLDREETLPEVSLPKELVRDILASIYGTLVVVRIKKNFLQLEVGDKITLAIRRRDVGEREKETAKRNTG